MKECVWFGVFFDLVAIWTRQNWFCSNQIGNHFQTKAKPGNFQPAVLLWGVSNWKGVYSGNLSSATTTQLAVAEMVPLKGMGLLLWVQVGTAKLCLFGVIMANTPAIMTGLLIAFMGVIAVNSMLNYTAITLPMSSIHWFLLPRQSTHMQLCSGEVSRMQVSLRRGIPLNGPDKYQAENRSWWIDLQKIIWLTKFIKRLLCAAREVKD